MSARSRALTIRRYSYDPDTVVTIRLDPSGLPDQWTAYREGTPMGAVCLGTLYRNGGGRDGWSGRGVGEPGPRMFHNSRADALRYLMGWWEDHRPASE